MVRQKILQNPYRNRFFVVVELIKQYVLFSFKIIHKIYFL